MGMETPEQPDMDYRPGKPLSNELIYKIAYQQANFEVLLENMSQGVGMFDGEHNIVFCNRRFFEIFGISKYHSDEVRTFRDVLELRVRTGCYPDVDACAYVQQCIATIEAQRSQTLIHTLRNGVIVLEKHIPFESGGWLTSFEDITEFYQLKREIEHLAYHDQLTGLPNRHGLMLEIENLAASEIDRISLLYLDLDGFKSVNDRYGHLIGDELLKLVALRLRESTKRTDKILRLGGDEFAILCRSRMGPGDAGRLARRIISKIEEPFVINGQKIEISVSIGVLTSDEHAARFDSLLKKADSAMYAAKRAGRGKFCIYGAENSVPQTD